LDGRKGIMEIVDTHVYLGDGRDLSQDAATLLRLMDEAGVAFSVACSVDRYLAVLNREGNDLLLEAVRAHPDRIGGMASVNPWFGDGALKELKRALDGGLIGVMLHPPYQGYRLSDRFVDPILQIASEYGVPVYAHTGTGGIAEPLQCAELAMRFPQVSFILGHAGSSDYYSDAVRALDLAPNIWLETSRNSPLNYGLFRSRGCLDRVVFGSSAPEYNPQIERDIFCDIIVEEDLRRLVFSETAKRVFGGRLPL
jgi:predicted TIM-barrel fold metal-dependent hydrolase